MMEPKESTGRRGLTRSTLWRDVLVTERRSERARVVPLPLALAAMLFPFLAAWAAAEPPAGHEQAVPHGRAALQRELPRPLQVLGRADRVTDEAGRYVDVWGRATRWEADAIRRRGYVRPGH